MSLFDDYLADAMFYKDYPRGVPNRYWVSKDGKRQKISQMTSEHIRNCMDVIGEDDPWYYYFEAELCKRGELVKYPEIWKNCN